MRHSYYVRPVMRRTKKYYLADCLVWGQKVKTCIDQIEAYQKAIDKGFGNVERFEELIRIETKRLDMFQALIERVEGVSK